MFKSLNHKYFSLPLLLISSIIYSNCGGSDDNSPGNNSMTPSINISGNITNFGATQVLTYSDPKSINFSGSGLSSSLDIQVSDNFQVSLDNVNYSSNLSIEPSNNTVSSQLLYVRFAPVSTALGNIEGSLEFLSNGADTIIINLQGNGTPVAYNYQTFNNQALGFGSGFSQSVSQVFNLHQDLNNIASIKMFLQIDCPSTGCDDWDRFANITVKDQTSGQWYEIGRYITPYWTGTQVLDRGLEFDVTDFKSLLTGNTEIRIYIENWTSKADLVSLEFDYVEGTPDYTYYAVSEVLGYHANSISGVPYGVSHDFDLDKSIQIPNNVENAHLRTIISGWGHATPADSGNRRCAEWCFRTHQIKINGGAMFNHSMEPEGCASNPIGEVQNPGNWSGDRAGWCPGMAVPVRSNNLEVTAGNSFNFEYEFEDWNNDGLSGSAYYAISTYVIVKSNQAITAPIVND